MNQLSVSTVNAGGVRASIAGDGRLVSASEPLAGKSAQVEVQLPGKGFASPSVRTGRSVVDLAIALGMSPALAQRTFGSLAAHAFAAGGPRGVASPVSTAGAASRSGPRLPGIARPTSGTFWTETCASVDGGSGHRVHGYGCLVRYKDYVNGNDWWIADEATASGWSTNNDFVNPDRLTRLRFSIKGSGGEALASWRPNSTTAEPSSCKSTTVSVTSPKSGATYSSDTTVCADSMGMYLTSNHLEFGALWSGREPAASWYEGVDFTDVWHSPPGTDTGGPSVIWIDWT